MSHIHLPDGILSPYFWVTGYIICIGITALLLKTIKPEEVRRKIPFTAIISALMLITMSVPLGFIPVHLSLAVVTGIIAGPALGFIAVFVVNVMLGFIGHGGITVVGINTLIIGSEVFVGSFLYRYLLRKIKSTPRAVVSTVLALIVSTTLMVVVVVSTIGAVEALPHEEDHGHESGELEWMGVYNLLSGDYVLRLGPSDEDEMTIVVHSHQNEEAYHQAEELLETGLEGIESEAVISLEDDGAYDLKLDPEGTTLILRVVVDGEYAIHTGHTPEESDMMLLLDDTQVLPHQQEYYDEHLEDVDFNTALNQVNILVFTGWSAVGIILIAGFLIEAMVTAMVIRFFIRVRPDIVNVTAETKL